MSKKNFSNNKVAKGGKPYDAKGKGKQNTSEYGYRGKGSSRRDNEKYDHHARYVGTDKVPGDTTGYANDPEWYTNRNNTGLAGTYSFFQPVGIGEDVGTSQTVQTNIDAGLVQSASRKLTLPGICRISLAHTIGAAGTITGTPGTSPINVALNKLYSNIRHANSGARNYEKSDLGIYLLAVADAYSYYGMMVRAYSAMRKYSTQNRYYAKQLVMALGFDFDSLSTQLPNFKTYINQYAMRLNVLNIPGNWPYFKRRYMLYANVYADEPSEKAQLYVFVPKYFLKFTRDSQDGRGQLAAKYFSYSSHITLPTIQSIGDNLISDIIRDDDFNLMSGDIAKYTDDLFHLPFIPDDTILNFTIDPMIMGQIENMSVDGVPDDAAQDGNVVVDQKYDSQMDDYLECNVTITKTYSNVQVMGCGLYYSKMKRMLNVHKPTVTEGEMLDITRLMNKPSEVQVGATDKKIVNLYDWCGTELVADYTIFTDCSDTSITGTRGYVQDFNSWQDTTTEGGPVELLQFNGHPNFPIIHSSTAGTTAYAAGTIGNIDNHIYLDVQDMKRVHEASLLSLFDVN